MYKVTLSMPIYNVALSVERALLSALNQTFESIEFLIVDDKGTDNSMDIVRRIIAEHPRGKDVRIIEHEKNIGLGAARNTAIDNAKGEYLFFMDSDDKITLDCIEVLYRAMEKEPVDFVAASFNNVDEKKNIKKKFIYNDTLLKGEYIYAKYYYKDMNKFSIHIWNKLYDLSFLHSNSIRCIPHQLNEDNIFSYKVIFHTNSFRLLSNTTLYHYYYNASIEGEKRKQGISYRNANEIIEILSYYKSLIEKYKNTFVYKYYIGNLVLVLNFIFISIQKSKLISTQDKLNYVDKIRKMNLVDFVFFDLLLINPFKIRHVFSVFLYCCPNHLKYGFLKFGLLIKNMFNIPK